RGSTAAGPAGPRRPLRAAPEQTTRLPGWLGTVPANPSAGVASVTQVPRTDGPGQAAPASVRLRRRTWLVGALAAACVTVLAVEVAVFSRGEVQSSHTLSIATAQPAAPEQFTLKLAGAVALQPGGTATLPVALVRHGSRGLVQFNWEGLPAGVTGDPVTA